MQPLWCAVFTGGTKYIYSVLKYRFDKLVLRVSVLFLLDILIKGGKNDILTDVFIHFLSKRSVRGLTPL